jgi:hypothetical protein
MQVEHGSALGEHGACRRHHDRLGQALADSPATLDALAAWTGLTRRAARISADAMVALGLLEVRDGTYRNGKAAARFLAGPGSKTVEKFLTAMIPSFRRSLTRCVSPAAWSQVREAERPHLRPLLAPPLAPFRHCRHCR